MRQRVIINQGDMVFVGVTDLTKGGAGSGNFGHAGIPGQRGGSAGGGIGGGGGPRVITDVTDVIALQREYSSGNLYQWDKTKQVLSEIGIKGKRGEGGATTSVVTTKMPLDQTTETLKDNGWEQDWTTKPKYESDPISSGFSNGDLRLIAVGDDTGTDITMANIVEPQDWSNP